MSENSRSRVTITLGRSGQVVKRAGDALSNSFIDSEGTVGGKRSVRDRLGSDSDSSGQFNIKRQRRDGSAANDIDDIRLSKGDLRFKILQKSKLKQRQNALQNGTDLRNILSRPAQSSSNSRGMRARVPEPKEMRLQHTDPRDGRQHFPETRDGRQLMTMTRDSRQSIPDYREQNIPGLREQRMPDPRQKRMPEFREARRSFPELKDVSRRMPEPSHSTIMGPMPGSRTANAATKVDSVINSYSPWTVDRLRRRSPDETLASSSGLSSTRRDGGLLRKLPVRAYDDTRTSTYMSKDSFEFSRPTSSSSYLTNLVPPAAQTKTMAPVAAPLLPGSLLQKSSYAVDDQLTVDSFLQSLGLEKYAIHFKAEEVDMYALRQMGDIDLKDLGIPMGPRKKILLSLLPLSKRQAR
ncbi:bicaudal C homolog 1-like [Olea europaea subsp. europaea]|uniref:Bicaudal C homolog 1-like n=2 Tax=Olea europaea subsp. europaea TaxID=158383 RepID=A0A8S0QVH1_OLEEU|nr:bicaudal C homolog 1-like [Olea europaea subsp. europaea]